MMTASFWPNFFCIFQPFFPAHLERFDAIASNDSRQVETESHALKGMLL